MKVSDTVIPLSVVSTMVAFSPSIHEVAETGGPAIETRMKRGFVVSGGISALVAFLMWQDGKENALMLWLLSFGGMLALYWFFYRKDYSWEY